MDTPDDEPGWHDESPLDDHRAMVTEQFDQLRASIKTSFGKILNIQQQQLDQMTEQLRDDAGRVGERLQTWQAAFEAQQLQLLDQVNTIGAFALAMVIVMQSQMETVDLKLNLLWDRLRTLESQR